MPSIFMFKQSIMNWEAKLIKYKGQPRIGVYFERNTEWIARIKKQEGARWSMTLKTWHLPDTEENRAKYRLPLAEERLPSADGMQHLNQFKRYLMAKRYSDNTLKTYTEALKSFLVFFRTKPLAEIDNQDVIDYNNDFILKNKLSASYQNQIVSAIKLYFSTIKKNRLELERIERPMREKKLPNVLSKEEIKMILDAPSNLKHKTMLALIYSCGLRRSELLSLKPAHIDSKRGLVIVRQAKGNKDRIVPLSPKVLIMLRDYYAAFRPTNWLFEGQALGPYDERSLSSVLKQALAKTNIKKPVSLHWLRHSYATHLLENGTDLRHIQEILGHNSSRTTEIYTHVSTKSIKNVKSPFDDL
jgi:integrase/recombinase XerD